MKTQDTPIVHRVIHSEVVSLDDARRERDAISEAKFKRFVDARNKSWQPDATVEDGIAAGKAYAEFLHAFTGRRS